MGLLLFSSWQMHHWEPMYSTVCCFQDPCWLCLSFRLNLAFLPRFVHAQSCYDGGSGYLTYLRTCFDDLCLVSTSLKGRNCVAFSSAAGCRRTPKAQLIQMGIVHKVWINVCSYFWCLAVNSHCWFTCRAQWDSHTVSGFVWGPINWGIRLCSFLTPRFCLCHEVSDALWEWQPQQRSWLQNAGCSSCRWCPRSNAGGTRHDRNGQ